MVLVARNPSASMQRQIKFRRKGAPRSFQGRQSRRSWGFWLEVCGFMGELLEAGFVLRGFEVRLLARAAAQISSVFFFAYI